MKHAVLRSRAVAVCQPAVSAAPCCVFSRCDSSRPCGDTPALNQRKAQAAGAKSRLVSNGSTPVFVLYTPLVFRCCLCAPWIAVAGCAAGPPLHSAGFARGGPRLVRLITLAHRRCGNRAEIGRNARFFVKFRSSWLD